MIRDMTREIIAYNVENPVVLRFMEDDHIVSAPFLQMLHKDICRMRSDVSHPILHDIRRFLVDHPGMVELPTLLFMKLHELHLFDLIAAYMKDPKFRKTMYFVQFLTHLQGHRHHDVHELYIVKKGKNHVFLVFTLHDNTHAIKHVLPFHY